MDAPGSLHGRAGDDRLDVRRGRAADRGARAAQPERSAGEGATAGTGPPRVPAHNTSLRTGRRTMNKTWTPDDHRAWLRNFAEMELKAFEADPFARNPSQWTGFAQT